MVSGNPAAIGLLLDAGADASLVDSAGDSPLHVAVSYGDVEAVEALLEAGAEPNVVSDYGSATPLTFAAEMARSDLFGLLIEFGAEPSPLDLVYVSRSVDTESSAGSGHEEIVETLLDLGIRPSMYIEELGLSVADALEAEQLWDALGFIESYLSEKNQVP